MAGYVYIAQNSVFPDILKIGQTTDVKKRMLSLSGDTSHPGKFTCLYSVRVENFKLLEQQVHEHFKNERVSLNKEFFKVNLETAKSYIESEKQKDKYNEKDKNNLKITNLTPLKFRELPPFLTKSDLRRLAGRKEDHLKVSINRWIKRGILKKAGERSGMYYNLVNDPVWQNHVLAAVTRKFPSAILAGPSVLHAHGCQTQIPSSFHVIVLTKRTLPSMDNVVWMPRPRKWYAANIPEDNLYGIRSLSPRQALQDGLEHAKNPGAWVPDMDDIDMDEIDEVSKTLAAAPKKKTI